MSTSDASSGPEAVRSRPEPIAEAPPGPMPDGFAEALARLREELSPDELHLPGAPAAAPYAGDVRSRAATGTVFAVAAPRTVPAVQTVLRIAHAHRVSVIPRGAGTGLSGGAVPDHGSIVLTLEHLDRIREIDVLDEVAVVEAGVITGDLDAHLMPLGFFYAPDPASAAISSIGGNIATNAGGLHCAKYGVTRESVLGLEVVLADGTLLCTGHRSIKGVTGLDLTQLIIGSEGTLAVVVAATLRIRPRPPARRTVLARFPDAAAAGRGVNAISRSPVRPAATELMTAPTLRVVDAAHGSELARGDSAVLLLELDGYGVPEQTADLVAVLEAEGAHVHRPDDAEAEMLWALRRAGRGRGEGTWRIGEDVAVPASRLAEMLEQVEEIGRGRGVEATVLAHAGDGNLHPAFALPIPDGADPDRVPQVLHEAADDLIRAALALGGTISGEHGIGRAKLTWLDLELPPASRQPQSRIKAAFDPCGILNPGKAI
ncbi:FAD-binding oxidoreductase [Brachybacterium hainanense]|uniref:FAD-binding oxidoreductase n=1 Tax=Brachybacterium hainanense TaxID=1541174 RepID=A0ABV6RG82_9MICO